MHEYTSRIRDHINGPRLQYLLLKDIGKWNQLCSSLDVIEDTALAVNSYTAEEILVERSGRDYGARYLALYGLMQALFLQQDAVVHLCEALDIPFSLKSLTRLGVIRDVRNASTGHPTKRGSATRRSHHFISRISLGSDGFTLLSTDSEGTHESADVGVSALIAHQSEDIAHVLLTVIADLDKRMEDHKVKFMNDRLADAFPETIGYAFEKLGEALLGPKPSELGLWAVDTVEQAMNDFRDGLIRQDMGLDTFDSVKYLYEELGYALPELRKFLQNDVSDVRNVQMARIATFFIYQKLRELQDIAREIDNHGDRD